MGLHIKKLRSDLQKEDEGVWVDLNDGARILVGRIGGNRYSQVIRELSLPKLKEIRGGDIPAEDLEDITLRSLARAALLGWENLEDDDGIIEYSENRALELLRTCTELRRIVEREGTRQANFLEDVQEESAKNS